MAKKRKRTKTKMRQALRGMKKFAAFIYKFASFVLIILSIIKILKDLL